MKVNFAKEECFPLFSASFREVYANFIISAWNMLGTFKVLEFFNNVYAQSKLRYFVLQSCYKWESQVSFLIVEFGLKHAIEGEQPNKVYLWFCFKYELSDSPLSID